MSRVNKESENKCPMCGYVYLALHPGPLCPKCGVNPKDFDSNEIQEESTARAIHASDDIIIEQPTETIDPPQDQKPREHNSGSLTRIIIPLIIFLVIGGVGGYYYSYTIYQPQIDEYTTIVSARDGEIIRLEDDIQTNIAENQKLESDKSSLQSEFSSLFVEYNSLELQHNTLFSNYQSITDDYYNLVEDYDELSESHNQLDYELRVKDSTLLDLESDIIELENIVEVSHLMDIGNNITSFYDCIRYRYGLAGDKSSSTSIRDKLKFGVKLVKHDLGYSQWSAYESDFFTEFGVYSYEYDSSYLQNILSYYGVKTYDSSSTKIKKILDFTTEQVTYQREMNDILRFPLETLSLGSGDCDDYSILVATLFEYMGIDSALAYFETNNGDHVLVLVHLEKLEVMNPYYEYLYYSYDDLTHYGLQSGKWIMIEPQSPIDYQGDPEWFDPLVLKEAVEISG